jgi:RNA 2',3'-cyclic 3'-phosphodiesterase
VRVFFALWPDAAGAAALARAGQEMHEVLGGRATREDVVHLTLAFLGDVETAKVRLLLVPPADLACGSFDLQLDQWGCWPRSQIGWVAPLVIPEAFSALVSRLNAWLQDAGFPIETRPFRPHVTLIRKARCAPLAKTMAPISWPVTEFVLTESRLGNDGPQYRTLGRWPLR